MYTDGMIFVCFIEDTIDVISVSSANRTIFFFEIQFLVTFVCQISSNNIVPV